MVVQREVWWLKGRCVGSERGVVAEREVCWLREKWWLSGRCGGSEEGVVAQREVRWLRRVWWLRGRCGGSLLVHKTFVPSLRLTVFLVGLLPGMTLAFRLSSGGRQRKKNYEKDQWPTKKKLVSVSPP